MLVQVEDLRVTLRKSRINILDGVSFHINAGETLGVVGESGCGKSMTALSLMKLLPPVMGLSGIIRFEGKELTKLSKDQIRKIRGNEMSMIFQEPLTSLNPLHTVGKQIGEALLLHTDMNKEQRHHRAVDLLDAVGIPRAAEIVNEHPHQLSGGMRQRVMIAMAMACNPKLLICDEPTTALDVTVQAQILELMANLKTDFGTAMLMITHDLGVIAEVCDRVMVMYAGKVVEEADVKTLFADPKHPYTRGLMDSIPRIEVEAEVLGSIPGTVPLPHQMPKGCRFCDRCAHVMDLCRQKSPAKRAVGDNHFVSCWLYEEGIGDEGLSATSSASAGAIDSTNPGMDREVASTRDS